MAKQDTECPFCHDLLEVNSEWLGMTLTCPHCSRMFVFGDPDPDIAVKRPVKKESALDHLYKNNSGQAATGDPGNMFTPLRKYAVFSGRATRREYWLFSLFTSAVTAFFYTGHALCTFLLPQFAWIFMITGSLAGIFLLLPSWAVMVRRCHDANRPGWRILIALIPCLGWLLLLYTLCKRSTDDNQYGPNPNAGRKDEVWPVIAGIIFPTIILSVLFAGMATFFPIFEKHKEMIRRIICVNHLTRIGTALEVYSSNQEGQLYPPAKGEDGLEILRQMDLEEDIFICPSDITKHYFYVGGKLAPRHRAFAIPTVICFAHPGNSVNVLMANGSVRSFIMENPTISCAKLVQYIIDHEKFEDPTALEACKKVLKTARKIDRKRGLKKCVTPPGDAKDQPEPEKHD